ncbi:glycogen/starch/alpha-glucan phosphorylase [Candidatus Venteria ishoeyi]|uniref:glycogen/starch/alpha-glucan phosphorylase n=1 Tax=Candidatus Venteria ishoeyi TaxID=1899563 RepID=UPI0025A5E4D0|nr:glycogen/starch/alpha-glucan phosphorylase [Candidatus Venteria ishoeyi]MDM8545573.1 glycogen/starch/alpha-glucan phosphorylase [Candidatus Venteria ishoeyi]
MSKPLSAPVPVSTPVTAKDLDALLHFYLNYVAGIRPAQASKHDICNALSLAIRNHLIDNQFVTEDRYQKADSKRMYYLSMEFLIGRLLASNLHSLGLEKLAQEVLQKYGVTLQDIEEAEPDAALGNGGLGRLAACFLDSLASLDMPGFGYGINYEYGLFKQHIDHGYQRESPDHWLHEDAPWLIERSEATCNVPLYGHIDHNRKCNNGFGPWVDWQTIVGVPFDIPVVGYGGRTVNYLRLYSARSSNEFDIQIFNGGDYIKAVEEKIYSEKITKVLYPSDSCWGGKELRLIQEYFLVSCAIRDILNRHLEQNNSLDNLADKTAIQLNDTHPSLSVAELMRVLMDEYGYEWKDAWETTQACCAYTNHTLLPEALEKWPVALLQHVLPRHLELIYEINRRFLMEVEAFWPGDENRQRILSLFEESHEKQVRMAHLAIVGSHSVNGVAALHSKLVQTRLVPDFFALYPERFNNKTNGVTPRRWIVQSNPSLTHLFNDTIGTDWVLDLSQLKKLEQYADDAAFQRAFAQAKLDNKERLAQVVREQSGIMLNPASMFDVQVKRIHEYKRQLLNILRVIHEYLRIVEDGKTPEVAKTCIFAGKAAPGYVMAKLIIKLINSVAEVVNHDPVVGGMLKVAFIPDYKVSLAEKIIPAANLSEQISTAGTEASGTGNMKFSMNGALTVGTLDGANVEILEEVGQENIYIFGLSTEEVEQMRLQNSYISKEYYQSSPAIKRILDSLVDNRFCRGEPGIFNPIFDMLLDGGDYFYHLADLESYIAIHQQIDEEFMQEDLWTRKAILNTARMGKFSSDRTILEYARDIWGIQSA